MSLADDLAAMFAAVQTLIQGHPPLLADIQRTSGKVDPDGGPVDDYRTIQAGVAVNRAEPGPAFGVTAKTVSGRTDAFGRAVDWMPWTLWFTAPMALDTSHRVVLADAAGVVHYLYVIGTRDDQSQGVLWYVDCREYIR